MQIYINLVYSGKKKSPICYPVLMVSQLLFFLPFMNPCSYNLNETRNAQVEDE